MRCSKLLKKFNILTHILKLKPNDFFNKKDEILEITSEGNIIWCDFAKATYITFLDEKNQLLTKNIAPAKLRCRSYIV
jgi:hypothetical protein